MGGRSPFLGWEEEAQFWDGKEEARFWDGKEEAQFWDGKEEAQFWDGKEEARFWDGKEEARFWDGRKKPSSGMETAAPVNRGLKPTARKAGKAGQTQRRRRKRTTPRPSNTAAAGPSTGPEQTQPLFPPGSEPPGLETGALVELPAPPDDEDAPALPASASTTPASGAATPTSRMFAHE